jgi:hypothetical protein
MILDGYHDSRCIDSREQRKPTMAVQDRESKFPSRIDLKAIEDAIGNHQAEAPRDLPPLPPPEDMPSPTRYAPPKEREKVRGRLDIPAQSTTLQTIAKSILALPWREAEAMGKAIDSKKQDSKTTIAAIMDWAFDWETFRDEERPSKHEE